MIDWNLTPENQALYERVVAQTRRIQKELGIEPMTLEERARSYERKRAEIERRQQEVRELEQRISRSRPPPKWKI